MRFAFFSPRAKVFACSTVNAFVINLESGLEDPQKRMETRGIIFSEAEKRTETRQRCKNARRLPDIWCVFLQMPGSLLAFFHQCLVCDLFQFHRSLNEMKFYRKFFPSTIYTDTANQNYSYNYIFARMLKSIRR